MAQISARTATVDAHGDRIWVYARDIAGRYHHIHRWTSVALHAFLIVVPWLSIGGHRVLFVDLPARRVWVLGALFTAADGALLMLMLLMASFALFFFTSLYGRLWCGFACPHSVFLINWVLPLEKWIEGDQRDRRTRDGKGVTAATTARKAVKFAAFGLVAVALSAAFMGFFSHPAELWTLRSPVETYGVVAFFAGIWFFDFAYFREQTCNYVCPYARFQGALMDDHSLTIAYDEHRGEPRGGGRAAATDNRCLDCNWCVQVCPQGIDIRDGFQLECIACGRCVDACTSVMARANERNTTLVAYDTVAGSEGREHRRIRPRTVFYAALLAGLGAAVVGVLVFRAPFQVTVNRAPGSLYQLDDGARVRNTFLVHLVNTGEDAADYHFEVDGLPDATVVVAPTRVDPAEARLVPLVVQMDHADVTERTYPIVVRVAQGEDLVEVAATFKTPGPAPEQGAP